MMFKQVALTLIFASAFAATASARTVVKPDQNAFTRAAAKHLSDVVSPVSNDGFTHCNSVVECRKEGRDLSSVWEMKHNITAALMRPITRSLATCPMAAANISIQRMLADIA